MEQDGELACDGHNGSVLSLLPSALSQMKAPATKRRVLSSWSEDVVGALDQETSQVNVTGLGDAELGIAISCLTASVVADRDSSLRPDFA
jgi:hypothetical protein